MCWAARQTEKIYYDLNRRCCIAEALSQRCGYFSACTCIETRHSPLKQLVVRPFGIAIELTSTVGSYRFDNWRSSC